MEATGKTEIADYLRQGLLKKGAWMPRPNHVTITPENAQEQLSTWLQSPLQGMK